MSNYAQYLAWVGFGLFVVVGVCFWFWQRRWERDNPGKRGPFFR